MEGLNKALYVFGKEQNMREFTKEDVSLLIEDHIRMDIPEWSCRKPNLKDFTVASYTKHACNDIQEFLFKRMGVCPRASGEFIKNAILEYADLAKTCEFYAGNNSMIFKIQYDVAMDLYDVVYHLD